MAKSSAYWQKRFGDLEAASNKYGQDCFRQIEPAFEEAQREIERQINSWYGRFAKNNQITMDEAKRLLNSKELKEFKWDVQEYIKYGHQNELNQLWMRQLENASAKVHISRLEALKIRTQQAAEVAFGNEIDAVIELDDGEWCAFEIKLGAKKIDEGAENLIKVCNDIVANGGKAPKIMCVICGLSNAAYVRPDGVFVVPITALKD